MTNAIGTGTRNLPINIPTDEHALLGRLAGPGNMGGYVRDLILLGLQQVNAEAAKRLRDIRTQYYGTHEARARVNSTAMLVLFVCFLAFGPSEDMRRAPRRSARIVRAARRQEVAA